MGRPAARLGDFHVCPLCEGLVPHVGGPVLIGAPGVLVGGLPAANVGTAAVCAGAPDVIVQGSLTVLIGSRPAARMLDGTAHGGLVMGGRVDVVVGG